MTHLQANVVKTVAEFLHRRDHELADWVATDPNPCNGLADCKWRKAYLAEATEIVDSFWSELNGQESSFGAIS